MMKVNRGFESMIPKPKQEDETVFKNTISIVLFNREFSVSIGLRKVTE